MRTVWKITLNQPEQDFDLPQGARVVHVATQDDSPCLWLEVETMSRLIHYRTFAAYGTGHVVPDDAFYVGTARGIAGGLVFHVYELPQDGAA